MQTLVRNIIPEGRLLFRAAAYALLAAAAFAIPLPGAWWAGVFLSYMAFNLLVGKAIANFSDAVYRLVTRQPIDRQFILWRQHLELLSDIPDSAHDLYRQGMSPRQAAEHIRREAVAREAAT